ncbi:hypothetical protein IT396_02690 [Candidatus Nomurabacteria bacterium]|nr:hypothetical protein [Candidatus Nomurabacteria bacterium]
MDELELSGRRHLSAKRAAREHRYHSDYIGQLIRSGKVAGQKVGRSWYVDAESLSAYLAGESQPAAPAQVPPPVPTPPPAPVEAPAPQPVVETPVVEVEEKEEVEVVVPQPVRITKTPEPIVVEEKPQPIKISTPSPVPQPTGLRFVPDDEPIVRAVHTMPTPQTAYDDSDDEGDVVITPSVKSSRMQPVMLATLAVCAFALTLASSYFFVHRTIVAGSNTSAAVQLSGK